MGICRKIAIKVVIIGLVFVSINAIKASAATLEELTRIDFNNDQVIDGKDLDIIYSYNNTSNSTYDLNNDGVVDIYDITKVSKNIGESLKKQPKIVVDPGHDYGGDYGAVATHNGIKYEETVLNMEVAVRLKASLEAKGYRVELTRQLWERPVSKDAASSLKARTDFANAVKADLFISIHHDSSSSLSATGTSTHYSTYKPGIDNEGITTIPKGQSYEGAYIDTTPSQAAILSRGLANKIVNNIARDLGRINRGSADHNLYVTVNTNMAAVLVEGGFISNPYEVSSIANSVNQQKLADSIASSVKEMF